MIPDIFISLAMPVGLMLAGILLLIQGGNWTVDSAVYVAKKFGISPLVVGFTIIAFGTSLPELVISMLANFEDSPGIALGNVIGSNIANILLVIGVTAVIVPLVSSAPAIKKDLAMMLAATVLMGVLMVMGDIGRIAGFAMIVILAAYVFYQYRSALAGDVPAADENDEDPAFAKPLYAYGFLLLGLAAIALGAEFLVRGAKESAGIIGVPEAVVALSVIALGTSLPELSTCIIAGRRGHSDIVLGNIIGSNVFNILMILGFTAVVKPISVAASAPQLVDFDIYVMGLSSLLFAALIFAFGKIMRPVGIVFCGVYLVYNIYIYAIYIGT